jgi:hypothetical protein
MPIATSPSRMNRIVERCPSCGVEHDHRVDECEACGNAVRYWCRTHSREVGWLAGPACLRCDEEEARRAPRPRPTRAPPPSTLPPYPRFPPTPAAPVVPPPRPAKADELPRGLVERLFDSLLTATLTGIVGVLLGVVAGAVQGYRIGADIPATAMGWGVMGGVGGLLLGACIAAATFSRSNAPGADG